MLVNNPKEIAFQSPRVAGNAVYTARVLLGLMIIDMETYAAKSAQMNSVISYSKLKIYPNPSNDYFHYELPLKEGDNGMISIVDLSGKEVKSWNADFNNNLGSLDIKNFAKGVYIFELTINNDQKLVQKLIVK